jgi:hypothetical protein
MAVRRGVVGTIVLLAAVCALLAYLRDPPWLMKITSGLRPPQTDASGRRFRWSGGHASLFVPSNARLVSIPLRAAFDSPADPPVTVTITIDDRPADRLVLQDPEWHLSTIRLPAAGSRRVRRIDIRVDRTRDDNYGVAVGDFTTTRPPAP